MKRLPRVRLRTARRHPRTARADRRCLPWSQHHPGACRHTDSDGPSAEGLASRGRARLTTRRPDARERATWCRLGACLVSPVFAAPWQTSPCSCKSHRCTGANHCPSSTSPEVSSCQPSRDPEAVNSASAAPALDPKRSICSETVLGRRHQRPCTHRRDRLRLGIDAPCTDSVWARTTTRRVADGPRPKSPALHGGQGLVTRIQQPQLP